MQMSAQITEAFNYLQSNKRLSTQISTVGGNIYVIFSYTGRTRTALFTFDTGTGNLNVIVNIFNTEKNTKKQIINNYQFSESNEKITSNLNLFILSL